LGFFIEVLSRPEISLHQILSVMKTNYVKRTQKDYTLSFKLEVVRKIEQGELTRSQALNKYGIQAKSTIRDWLRKYGNFDWENQSYHPMPKSPQQSTVVKNK